jgi:hypothetical protein
MKIALCLHGYFNSLTDRTSLGADGYAHIKKHILDKGDVDIFIHSWDITNQKLIEDIYQPKRSIFEQQRDFNTIVERRDLQYLLNCPRTPATVLSHLYSVEEALKLPYTVDQKYDIVIKARFDLGRINRGTSGRGGQNSYAVQCINFTTEIEEGKLYVADWNHFHMGPADMWYYGSVHLMQKFTTLYEDFLKDFYIGSTFHNFATEIERNPGDLSNAIAYYKYWMIQKDLWNNRINLQTTWE